MGPHLTDEGEWSIRYRTHEGAPVQVIYVTEKIAQLIESAQAKARDDLRDQIARTLRRETRG